MGTALALYPDGHNGFYDFYIHVWTRGGELFTRDGKPALQSDAVRKCARLHPHAGA